MRTSLQMHARSASESRYPQLWRSTLGMWCPSLGPTGAALRDWSGRVRHGTLTSLTLANAWTTSLGKYAINLDGTGYILIGTSLSFGTGDFSLCGWVNSSSAASAQTLIANDNDANGIISLRIDAGAAFAQFRSTTGAGLASLTGPTVNDGIWHHLGCTRQGTAVALFVDGVSVATGITSAATLEQTNWIIGARNGGGVSHKLVGLVDDCRAYSCVLSNADFLQLYNGRQGRGIAYAMRERRRVKAAGGNRRRRLLFSGEAA